MIRKKNDKVNRKRIYFLFILFLIAFSLISYRLVNIQYIYASKYKNDAQYQHIDESILNSKRGKIFDRNGNELAISLIERTVYANPQSVVNPDDEAKILSEILEIDVNEIAKKLKNKELGFVYIKRKVNAEIAQKIIDINLPGIYVKNESKRFYPQDSLAASIIGFTGMDNNGLSGIELQYEKYLRGVDGKVVAEKDVFGNVIPGNFQKYIEPVNGDDIVITIDSQIQFIAEKKLEEVVNEFSAKHGIAVVMNPKNGEIYALANYPGFNLNNYEDFDTELYKSLGVSFTYEPGSTFKIINVASALDNNCVSSNQMFHLPYRIQVGDREIREIFRRSAVDYSTKEIIQHSSNVGAVTVALSMGEKLFWESIKEFGFGELTGIDLAGEEPGLFYDYKSWPESAIGALAIGQNISVTPIQLVRAVCAIANGGYLVTPNIIKEIRIDEDMVTFEEMDRKVRILKEETSSQVKDMMLSVVENGTGTSAQVEGVKVCGKTGTAEKTNENGAGYDEGRVITSFIGFAPYEDPEVAILVVVDEPIGGENEIWGGTVAAPVFSELMEFSLQRLKISDNYNF